MDIFGAAGCVLIFLLKYVNYY